MTDEELKRLFDETLRHIGGVGERLDGRIEELHRHFDVVAERLEARIDAVAESVAAVDEKMDRRIDDFEERMERGFADTQAMIKFSHDELDRRSFFVGAF